jgi:tetratricopeptide (TPR) repeat protein
LDIVQYNREQQKPSDQAKDDEIEQMISKRKGPSDTDDDVVSNLACLSIDIPTNADLETARTYARIAVTAHGRGDVLNAEQNYKQAMLYTSPSTLDWATYACRLAEIYIAHDDHSSALDLLQKALDIRKQLETNSQEIIQIQQTIDRVRLLSSK